MFGIFENVTSGNPDKNFTSAQKIHFQSWGRTYYITIVS